MERVSNWFVDGWSIGVCWCYSAFVLERHTKEGSGEREQGPWGTILRKKNKGRKGREVKVKRVETKKWKHDISRCRDLKERMREREREREREETRWDGAWKIR